MKSELMDNLRDVLERDKLSEYCGIPEGYQIYSGKYESLESTLAENPKSSYFYPLSNIPFNRANHIQLACVMTRVDFAFYLLNKTEVKNLAFLDSTHTLYYNHDLVADYMKEINPEVVLKKVNVSDLSKKSLAIHFGTFWTENVLQELSPEEFVPFPGAGLFVGVCNKDNLAVRKNMSRFHDAETFDLSNIQRGIQLKWPDQSDILYLSSFARRDKQSNIHTTVSYLKNHVLDYIHVSQSTTFNMVEEILEKL